MYKGRLKMLMQYKTQTYEYLSNYSKYLGTRYCAAFYIYNLM